MPDKIKDFDESSQGVIFISPLVGKSRGADAEWPDFTTEDITPELTVSVVEESEKRVQAAAEPPAPPQGLGASRGRAPGGQVSMWTSSWGSSILLSSSTH